MSQTLTEPHPPEVGATKRQWGWFTFLTVSLGLLWLVVFPELARVPQLRSEIDFLEEKQIDPTAMFYSDLETIEDTVQNIHDFHRENPNALW